MTNNINGNTPSIKNSKSIDQTEILNAKQNMNNVASKSVILGAELTANISNKSSLGNMTNSVPGSNSSTSVENQELQYVKSEIKKSEDKKGVF